MAIESMLRSWETLTFTALHGRPERQHIHRVAEDLIDIAIDHGLEQLLPRETTTFERQSEEGLQQTTIELA
jgi:hypothetical protein